MNAARQRYASDQIDFDVLRNGHKVGTHRVRFEEHDGALRVASRMELRLRLFFIEAYHFRYDSSETWCNDRLAALEANTDDNGTLSRVRARRDAAELRLEQADGLRTVSDASFPTTHWKKPPAESTEALNTITGQLNRIQVKPCGELLPGLKDAAGCRDYTGELKARVWYDEAGRWHGLAFDGRDGSRIEYRLARRTADP